MAVRWQPRCGSGRRWQAKALGRVLLAAACGMVTAGGLGAAPAPPASYVIKPADVLNFTPAADVHDMPAGAWRLSVRADGTVDLGNYGMVHVAGMTAAEAQAAIQLQLAAAKAPPAPAAAPMAAAAGGAGYVLQAGDTVQWSADVGSRPGEPPLVGQGVVGSDGLLRLGEHGAVRVAGLTSDQAKAAIEAEIARHLDAPASAARANGPVQAGYLLDKDPIPAPRTPPPARLPATAETPARPSATASPAPTAAPAAAPAPRTTAPVAEAHPAVQAMSLAGPACGPVGGPVPQECARISLPDYVIDPPDILLIESTQSLRDQPIRGQHLVRPDGTISLGIYGTVHVAGLTLEQARAVIVQQISARVKDLDIRNLYVDVLAYNSKVYYVITDGGGYGEQVYRLPITGNETVLDAISQINGLPPQASKKKVWVARPNCTTGGPQTLPVNWVAITQCAQPETNYQLLPGDRVYVMSSPWIRFDSAVSKFLAPFERMVGFTLLSGETVEVLKFNNNNSNSGFGGVP